VLLGPPGGVVDVMRQELYVFERCRRKDTVTEIEDVAGAPLRSCQHVVSGAP
jgi:hypothetical protein